MNIDDPDNFEIEPSPHSPLELRVLGLLAKNSMTSAQLMHAARAKSGSLRNAITNLRREGLIAVANKSYPRRYKWIKEEKRAA
jgi:hypothetical protein